MAETKTTIPVEIKMGNAGTNDANLPAFKEGSIIFTKDTKKIYIDPVGETERIAVGGEVDLSGKQDTITDSTNLTVNNLIVSSVLSLGKNDSETLFLFKDLLQIANLLLVYQVLQENTQEYLVLELLPLIMML